MTGLEHALLGIVILFGGGIGGKLILPGVSRRDCKRTHVGLEKLFDAKFESVEQRLERIEHKIDANGKNKS